MKRTKADAAKTRALIVETAYHTFLENGYEGTTLLEIVKRANLSRGAMYWHFDNKDQLYLEVIRIILKDMYQHKVDVIHNYQTLEDKLTHLLSLPLYYVEDYRLVTYTSDLVKRFPQFQPLIDEIQDAKEKLYQLLIDLLVEEINQSRLPHDFPIQVTVDTLYFLFEGFYFDGVENKYLNEHQIRNIVHHLLAYGR